MKKTKVIFIILTIIWMVVIFCLSNQPADETKRTSSNTTRTIVNIIYRNTITEQEKESKVEELDPIIRKLAHYTIYTIGGIIICITLTTYKIKTKNKIIITQLIGSIYAVTDEIHQYFVPRKKLPNKRCSN